MSWELIRIKEITCPCGKGKIKQEEYADDWGRFEYENPYIECEACKQKYRVESTSHNSYKPHRGDSVSYYLIDKNYPEYDGISEEKMYGTKNNNVKEISFCDYLIENYKIEDLNKFLININEIKNSNNASGQLKEVIKLSKTFLNTVKLSIVKEHINEAISKYNNYFGSCEQREIIRKQELEKRKIYEEEKSKFKILLNL